MHVYVHMYYDQDRRSDPGGKKQLTTVSMETGKRWWKSVSLCMCVMCMCVSKERERVEENPRVEFYSVLWAYHPIGVVVYKVVTLLYF